MKCYVWDGTKFYAELGREPDRQTLYFCDYLPLVLIVVCVLGVGILAAVLR